MRIGVNCFPLEAGVGGVKQYFITLFDWLLEHDLENEYVFFHCERNVAELLKLRFDRWRRQAILLGGENGIAGHFREIDLYFCPFNVLWPRPVPLPGVVTLADIQEVFYPQFFSEQERQHRGLHYQASTRAAERVVTVSQFSKESIAAHHRLNRSRIIVAHHSPDPAYLKGPDFDTPPEPPIPFRRFVLFPGNRWRHKNHDTLLLAMKLLQESGERTNLVVTGFDMPGGYPLEAKAAEYGVADCIHNAGYVTVRQMAYLYRAAEMTVFPSLFEGFGLPPLEAMAVGCPVVVANSTSLPEVCGDAAQYFEPTDVQALADAIRRVRSDPALRASMVEKGQARAKEFSTEAMARAHLRAFQEAVHSFSPLRRRWQEYRESGERWLRQVAKTTLDGVRLIRRLGERKLIVASGMFEAEFYQAQVGGSVGVSAVGHYLLHGAKSGLAPHPLFSGSYYWENNPDVAAAGSNPLVHFLRDGAREGRSPHPLFDLQWYVAKNPNVAASAVNPLMHFLREKRSPHPLFDADWYLEKNKDVAAAGLNPLAHFVQYGAREGRDPHPLFDLSWYAHKYPDVAASGINPLEHYVRWGAAEKRSPHRLFDPVFYANPLMHYLMHQAGDPNPLFDGADYLQRHPEVAAAGMNSLVHYVARGEYDPVHPYTGLIGTSDSPKNVLFVLYGSFRCNSASHVHSLARELTLLGFSCAVAVPFGKETADLFPGRQFEAVLYQEVERGLYRFPNGRGPDIVHAWTPREIVRRFCATLAELYQFRQYVHMEDNEELLLASMTRRPWEQLASSSLRQLDEFVPESLTHPLRGREFMRNSCGVTLILEKLKELVPEKPPSVVLWPSAQSELFSRPLPKHDGKAIGIPDAHAVIVYTGHVNQANAREIRALYLAVGRLNREGFPLTLVRTGENNCALLTEEEDWIKRYIIELGTVPRESLPSIMATADLFVQPGRPDAFNDYRFPSKLPEFLSIGRPVILPATNIGLQMVHGKDGWILPDADEVHIAEAVRTILGDPRLYETLAAGAVEFFRTRLDWKRTAQELADFYGSISVV